MFTVEYDHDEIRIVILDDNACIEDVDFCIYDDYIYIRQWNDLLETHEQIQMSPTMLQQFLIAFNKSEGAYIMEKDNG